MMKDNENVGKERPNEGSSEIQGEESIPDTDDDDILLFDEIELEEEDTILYEDSEILAEGSIPFSIDVVFVIDCTAGVDRLLKRVKQQVLHFEDGLREFCEERGYTYNSLRIRIIGFRDFYFDWMDPDHPPIEASSFFNIPEQQEELAAFLDRLKCTGGEDEPESGLEALHLAFHSDWKQPEEGARNRQIVVLVTESTAHPLNDPMRYDSEYNSHYPEGMPESLDELQNEYNDPEVFPAKKGRRLILFAPELWYSWSYLVDWYGTMIIDFKYGDDPDIVDMNIVYHCLI